MRRSVRGDTVCAVVLALASLIALPVSGAADQNRPTGPVRTVRQYLASFKMQNGQWVKTDRYLNMVCEYDRKGNLVEERWYNWYSSCGQHLESKTIYRYDSRGRKSEEIRLNYPDPAATAEEDRTTYRYGYDRKGRLARTSHYGPDGALTGTRVFEYDTRGNKVSERWDSADGSESRLLDIFGYDRKGRLVERLSHDTVGRPLTYLYTYDARGKVTEQWTHWGEGGTSRDRFRYDAKGNRIEHLVGVADGGFEDKYTSTYDERGNLLEQARYRRDELTEWLTTHFTYDAEGRLTEESSLRGDGGVDHRTTYRYGPNGKLAEKTRYGPGDWLGGRSVSAYDEEDRLVELANYDRELLNNRSVFRYDRRGKLSEETQYGPQGELLGKDQHTYDDLGRETDRAWQEADGTITTRWSYEYDQAGHLAREVCSLSHPSWGSRRDVIRYDAEGRITEEQSFSDDGSLERRVRHAYDPQGRRTEEVREYGDGSLSERTTYAYDAQGRLAEELVYYGDGSLRLKTVYACDAQGRKVEAVQYFGALSGPKTAHRYQFDRRGNMVETVTAEVTTRYGQRYLRPLAVCEVGITYWR